MRRAIGITLLIAFLVVAVNDVAKYATAERHLRATSYDAAQWAGNNTRDITREEAATRVAEKAAQAGVTVYQYGRTETEVQVWSRYQVEGTWVAGTIVNMFRGMSFREAKAAPFVITNYREARFM